jgi:hypothetical protein
MDMKRHMLICILISMFMEESKEIVMLESKWQGRYELSSENLPIYISSLVLLSLQQMYDILMK